MRELDTPPTAPAASPTAPVWQRLIALLAKPAVAVPLLTLLAVALRLYKLSYRDYFDDEVITTFAARLPAQEIFRSIGANDTHPPGYHILLHFWRACFGESLIALRLFSVTTSAACIPLIYILGRMLASRPVALVAAALMAIAPFQIYHAQQARMYPLLTMVVLATTVLFIHAWNRGGWLRWLGFGICAAVGLYTHIYFPLSLLALDLWAIYESYRRWRIDKARWTGLIAAQALAVLAFLPFLPELLGTVRSVVQSFWIRSSTPFDWMFDLVSLANNATLAALPDSGAPSWYVLCAYLAAVAALVLALVYSVREAKRRPEERSAWILLHLLLWTPIVLATLISLTVRPIMLDRSLIGISSALFLIMAWMLVRFWNKRPTQIVAMAFLASCFASLALGFPNAPMSNDLVRLTDYIAQSARPGDAIAYADWQSFDTAALIHPEQPDVYILPGEGLDTQYWARRMEAMRWGDPRHITSAPEFAPRYQRVWLVFTLYTYNLEEHKQVSQGWLETHGRRLDRVEFGRAVLYLYEVAD